MERKKGFCSNEPATGTRKLEALVLAIEGGRSVLKKDNSGVVARRKDMAAGW